MKFRSIRQIASNESQDVSDNLGTFSIFCFEKMNLPIARHFSLWRFETSQPVDEVIH